MDDPHGRTGVEADGLRIGSRSSIRGSIPTRSNDLARASNAWVHSRGDFFHISHFSSHRRLIGESQKTGFAPGFPYARTGHAFHEQVLAMSGSLQAWPHRDPAQQEEVDIKDHLTMQP
jgi:hypothetical protein